MTQPHPSGQSSAEYLVVVLTVVLIFFAGQGNLVQRLLSAIGTAFERFSFLLALPS
ncbi:MAG: hypothetical protein R3E68_19065 [Burkholderiaceae bacterium]